MANLTATRVDDSGLTDLIQRMGRDCPPDQFVREFIKNSIEAVQRVPGTDKQIRIDVDWGYFEATGVHKICFMDNGDGMTGNEMLKHLNNLSSSGHANQHDNYGVGAKISALTRNHAGIGYESWKDGSGSSLQLRYDADEHLYGVQPLFTEDARYDYLPLPPDYPHKPEMIHEHGTKVTLFGMTEDEDTMSAPEGVRGGKENWLIQYANTRFFELPDGLDLKARVGYYRDRSNARHNYLRRIDGQRVILEKNSVSRGSVELSDATVHWWIMKQDREDHARQYTAGHCACLNEGEVLGVMDGRANKAPGFGIIFGKEHVVLYVEPNKRYVQNTARNGLVRKDGASLPWEKWQDEFRQSMPQELDAFIKEQMSLSAESSHAESIRERLKSIASFFKISRYRPAATGVVKVNPDETVMSGIGDHSHQDGARGRSRTRPGNAPGDYREQLLSDLLDSGVLAEETSPDRFPEVRWVSESEGLEDRAAQFIPSANLIKANRDFQGFIDVIQHFSAKYEDIEGAEQRVISIVQESFEQQLVEAVAGAMALKNRPRWKPTDFDAAISEEALTLAVMPKYHLINFIRRKLTAALGSNQGKVKAVA